MTASPLTLFSIRQRMRANLFTYRAPGDVWLRELRVAPVKTVSAALPRLTQITGEFTVSGEVKIRPADLTISAGYRRAGLVLVGDAFASTCPVTGTGTDKVFTDVERLCNIHIPTWLVSEGMGEDKIAAFYDDPVKKACDAWAMENAFSFRSVSMDERLYWKAQRMARFLSRHDSGLRAARRRSSGGDVRRSFRQGKRDPATSADENDNQRWGPPGHQQHEADQRHRKIAGRFHGGRPQRIVQGGAEQPDDRSVDPAHRGLRAGTGAERIPERQRADQDEDSRQEDAEQSKRGTCNAVRLGRDHGAEIGREGEERSGHRLCCAIAGEKGVIADPERRDKGFTQQRQHDMAAAKHQRARPVECGKQIEALRTETAG